MKLCLGTPVDIQPSGLAVKREDLASPPPGPRFSKMRGVWEHIQKRPETTIAALDTHHSQAGHAVAFASSLLRKQSIVFWPARKSDGLYYKGMEPVRSPQIEARKLGAELFALKAGRSCVLYHEAKRLCSEGWKLGNGEQTRGEIYLMPNGLQLEESVEETASEAAMVSGHMHGIDTIVIPCSSGTIAAGVIRGYSDMPVRYIFHLGYSRPIKAFLDSVFWKAGGMYGADPFSTEGPMEWKPYIPNPKWVKIEVVDEGYGYGDKAGEGPMPSWPCNPYYDLKAYRWLVRAGLDRKGVLFWNIG